MLVKDIGDLVAKYGAIARVPSELVGNTRNDMYLASESVRLLLKDETSDFNQQEIATLRAYKNALDSATKFIPAWVRLR